MKNYTRYIVMSIALCFALTNADAQYVTIPDANFRAWLNTHGFASCLNGNQMDTTCSAVVNATVINCRNSNISDLRGAKYFDRLITLNCDSNGLALLELPPLLKYLSCSHTQNSNLPPLPAGLLYLDCSYNVFNSSLPTLPSQLNYLDCSWNLGITALPALPANLKTLYCYGNNYCIALPTLPSLISLSCYDNSLTALPTLPASLTSLYCSGNPLGSLPTLPNSLKYLYCSFNTLTSLPTLPASLLVLKCMNNQLTSLPALPYNLDTLICSDNQLVSFPDLNPNLTYMDCNYNQLTSIIINLPWFSSNLKYLDCSHCSITSMYDFDLLPLLYLNCSNNYNLANLPSLPTTLTDLICVYNDLTSLPPLPPALANLNCSDNTWLFTLPTLPSSLKTLQCSNSPSLISLPTLPSSLLRLNVISNRLTSLPTIPASLKYLNCGFNLLTTLPALPYSLDSLYCTSNQLTSLPTLPDSMNYLVIANNTSLNCLPTIHKIKNFYWGNTGITCLPNTISVVTANPTITGVPICTAPSTPTSISVTGGAAKVCPGDTRTYTTPLVTGVTYNWTVPTGAIINSGQGTRTINVTYNSGFTSNGAISVVKKQGCGVSLPKTLAVNRNLPSTPSAITGTTYGLCGATNKTYSVTPVAGLTYQWTIPTGVTIVNGQGTNSITVNFPLTNVTGTIAVKGVNSCGAGAARNLTVRAVPLTPLSITGPATACANQQNIAYSTSTIASATSYNWTVPTGALITSGQGTTGIVMKYGATGGNIRVQAMNTCGVGTYKNLAVVINCREGFDDGNDFDVLVYPNPTKNIFSINVSNSNEGGYSLIVRDVIGRVVYQKKNILIDRTFDFGLELSDGVYIAEVNQGDKRKLLRLIKSN